MAKSRMTLVRSPVMRLRRQAKLSSERAAKDAGISRAYLQKIEQGATGASTETVARLAHLYGIAPEVLDEAIRRARKTYSRYLIESLT